MKEVKDYLQLEKGYDVQFVDFLIESAKMTIEGYCNQPIFLKEKEISVAISNNEALLPYSYITAVTDVSMDGVEIDYSYIKKGMLHWIATAKNGIADVTITVGFTSIPQDITLVLAEIASINYNNSRKNQLGKESETTSLGAENIITKFIDLTPRHKQALDRYRKITI